ncbi:MAG: tetratricopeptide repeat protein [Bacteroidia bacterium]|nr:tetratricopeptide repeat protein [Bacteroidia bacterium]
MMGWIIYLSFLISNGIFNHCDVLTGKIHFIQPEKPASEKRAILSDIPVLQLNNTIPVNNRDTVYIKKLLKLSNDYSFNKPDLSIVYADSALHMSEKKGWKKGQAMALNKIGIAYYYKGEYDKAIEQYSKGLEIAKEIEYRYGIGQIMGNMGVSYKCMSDYQKAMEYYKLALNICEDMKDSSGIAIYLGSLGNIHESLAEYPEALEYHHKSLQVASDIGDWAQTRIQLTDIGVVYDDLKDYHKALDSYSEALKIAEDHKDRNGEGYCLSNIGISYDHLSEYDKALKFYLKALTISEETEDTYATARNLANIGIIYAEKADYNVALDYYHKALKLAEDMSDKWGCGMRLGNIGMLYFRMANDTALTKTREKKDSLLAKASVYQTMAADKFRETGSLDNEKEALFGLSDTYYAAGNILKAYDIYKQATVLKDSIFNSSNAKKIARLEAKRELDIKEKQLEIQKLQIRNQDQQLNLLQSDRQIKELEMMKQFSEMNLLRGEKNIQALELNKKKLESEKNQKQINLLNKDKKYQEVVSRSLTGGLVIITLVLGLTWFFLARKRRDNRRLAALNTDLENKNLLITRQKSEIEESNAIIFSDISQAIAYVSSLLPAPLTDGPVTTDWLFIPSSKLGGDAFGYHWIDNDHFAFYILDVCGHGIGSALHSVSILHFIRSGTRLSVDPRNPELVLDALNKTFQSDDNNGLFFTMWYGVFNIPGRSLSYICAGHPAPLLISATGNTRLLNPHLLSVGILPDYHYTKQIIHVPEKADIYLFSDGVYEVQQPDGNMLQLDEFYRIIGAMQENNSVLTGIYDKVTGLQNSRVFADDFSLIRLNL